MRADGVIVSIDGWGNSNIDFASLIQEVGERGIPVVGMSFVGTQAQFVVTNKYMDTIVDFNKSKEGIETEVVGENNVVELDAKKALAFLKLKIKKNKSKEE
jgi:D-proline reductase (dithiol) PrdE